MSADEDRQFEVYKLVWDRVSREVDEVYTINNVFLVMVGAVLAGIGASLGKWPVHLIGGFVGALLAWRWGASLRGALAWRRWWFEELADAEARVEAPDVWQRVTGRVRTGHTPPVTESVTDPLLSLWRILFGLSVLSFASGVYLLCRGA